MDNPGQVSGDEPNTLVGFLDVNGRAALELRSGARLLTEVSVGQLERLLEAPLGEVCRARRVTVLFNELAVTESEWRAIVPLVRPHFADGSPPAALLDKRHDELARLPLCVYVGTGQGTTLYLSWPVDWKRQRDGRHYCQLHEPGYLWKVWVDLATGAVDVNEGPISAHFLDPAP